MRFKAFITKTTANAKSSVSKVSASVKLHSRKNSLNDELDMLFDTLGKMYYFGSTGDGISTEDMESVIQNITLIRSQITEIEEELRVLNGKKLCPSCSAELQRNISYCPHCGSRIVDIPTDAEDEQPVSLNDD